MSGLKKEKLYTIPNSGQVLIEIFKAFLEQSLLHLKGYVSNHLIVPTNTESRK